MLNSTLVETAVAADRLEVSRRGTPVLHQLTFTVPTGAIVGLMGPSGCGKTTLMRTIVGVQRIAGGSLTVLGSTPDDPANRPRLGYVTQAVSVYRDLTVRQNAAYFAALQGFSVDHVDDAVAAVGLTPYADRRVEQLSGGQASRASLACALVGDPDLLVLDEPTVGLDPVTREELWEHLRALADAGTTLLVSSHVMDEAERCDSVLLMRDGRLLEHLPPRQLLERTHTDSMDRAFLTLIKEHAA
ncbi:ABC transporter ATP-binding protein [Calidifontibacter sp. DB0510]|uniref:ABC transporter ATP-binding protein n=1 Tax=Metallococcus carri TaxID=1656884 RepID=A0A967B1V0_9MICO|nr:ABC transporter ATP-binding protein [Metallococcus carri]NHN56467.1 ABC transporter ATP-binding protein [Metallococcus carri]NOP36091.1 ABC transporter ATP-binding protein [Calidifontibacter sp. DB2511S]